MDQKDIMVRRRFSLYFCLASWLRRTLHAMACRLLPFQCFLQLPDWENFLLQNGHSNRGAEWVLRCCDKPLLAANVLSQFSHLYFRSVEWCLFLWSLRLLGCTNLLWQCSHSKDFAPVWMFMCRSLMCLRVNILGQKSHLNAGGKWVWRCRVRFCLHKKVFGHWSHL